ncbi:hypothetical protein [Mycobacterium sp. TY815]|uniref:hypothetical protein n=1 Tax=Mycobacterium sp. TY815 TaxID=3050581 RepID=UPI0027403372|nr:hypothetical protein [Mycobacterium sp. TY815]MDP7704290.1 hypothetical protein [Mycobacterium sp. TY815]
MTDHAEVTEISTARQRQTYTDAMTDVGSPVHRQIAVEDIANAIARRWQDEANTTVRMLTSTAIYLQERKLVEWVFESTKSAADHADVFKQIRKRGIDVGVVLPMPELGSAHEEFWGTGLTLYGWIDRGDEVIRFTGPEVA